VIVDCAYYRDGRRQEGDMAALGDVAKRCDQDGFVWLGLFEPTPQELDQVRDAFGLHELAVEDARTFHLRPKVNRRGREV
jgi:magnesium transporter